MPKSKKKRRSVRRPRRHQGPKHPKDKLPMTGRFRYVSPNANGEPASYPHQRGFIDVKENRWEWARPLIKDDPEHCQHWDVQHLSKKGTPRTNVTPEGDIHHDDDSVHKDCFP